MISPTELIDRYVYAVGKRLPYKIRRDVEQEITTLIQDMLEERCGGRPEELKDVRVVLAELGRPEELAVQYSPDHDKCLIGQPYYSKYKTVLKIVAPSVLFGMLLAGSIDTVIALAGKDVSLMNYFEQILGWIGICIQGLVTAFAVVTGIFALLQWKQVALEELSTETWESVARPVTKEKKNNKVDVAAGMVLSIVFLVIFIFAPQIICVVFTDTEGVRHTIPVLNTVLVRKLWYFTAAFASIGILRNLYCFFQEKYTVRTAAVCSVCDGLSLVLSIIWLTRYQLMNPELLNQINAIFSENQKIVRMLFENFQIFFLAVLTIALLMDCLEIWYKAFKNKSRTI